MSRPRLHTLPPPLRTMRSAIRPPPKRKDQIYDSVEFRRWRGLVMERSGSRCEAIEGGVRCRKAEPQHRMYADHITELKDGGQPFDVSNGRCLCASHHTAKTHAARRARQASGG